MSRLNELIQELCPDGVEFKKIHDVAEVGTGCCNGNEAEDGGVYPFFVRSQNVKAKNDFQYDEEAIIIPGEGGIGDIFHYVNGKYALHQRVYRIHFIDKTINAKFIYYYMKSNFKSFILKKAVSATVTSIRKPMIEKFEIPIPPLDVQNVIVRILDTFTSHAAELQAELQARKEQYEYYRNKMFDSRIASQKYKLSNVCIEIGDGLHGTPLYDEKGDYYFINGNNLVKGRITFNTQTKKINSNEFQRIGLKFSTNVVFLSINGTIGNVALYNNEPIALGKSVAYFVVNPLLLNVRFLYYYFLSKYAKIYFELNSTGSTIKNLGLKALRNMIIPIPSLSEQQRIVSILDKFEALVNDLTEGIPAEVAAVQEQYEYYRNKLLTFKQRA